MITYDLRIKFDPLVFALRRKADASAVERLKADLAGALSALGAQSTQLDLIKRMMGAGAPGAGAGGSGSGAEGGEGAGSTGASGGGGAVLMDLAAQVGSLSAEVRALRDQRAHDAAHIGELQRVTGAGGGADGYSVSDQLTDRVAALEANISSILKKVSRELTRGAGGSSPNLLLAGAAGDGDANDAAQAPQGKVAKGFDYGADIRKLGERLEKLVSDIVPVGALAKEAMALAEAASKSAATATQRAEHAEVAAQAITASIAAAGSAPGSVNGGGGGVGSGPDSSVLAAQLAALNGRLEALTRKQADEAAAIAARSESERSKQAEELAALKSELASSLRAQGEQLSAKIAEASAGATANTVGPSSRSAMPMSPGSVGGSGPSITSPRQGATLESLTSRIDIVTARIAAAETGLATTAKALVNLKNNVETIATHHAISGSSVGSSNDGMVVRPSPDNIYLPMGESGVRGSNLGAGRGLEASKDEPASKLPSAAASAAVHIDAEGAKHRKGGSALSASANTTMPPSIDLSLFSSWAGSVTSVLSTISGLDVLPLSGNELPHLVERAVLLAAQARPVALQKELKEVASVVEEITTRQQRPSSETASSSAFDFEAEFGALLSKVSSLEQVKADQVSVDERVADVQASLASLLQRVDSFSLQIQSQLHEHSASPGDVAFHSAGGPSPPHKDRGALTGRPLLRDLKCLSCDQPLSHGLAPEAGGAGPSNVLVPHLPVSKAWMFSQTGGGAILPAAQQPVRSASPPHHGSGAFTMLPNGHVLQRGLRPLTRAGLSAVQQQSHEVGSGDSTLRPPPRAGSSGGNNNQSDGEA